ncbi:hypothetical protein IMCC14465_01160 [alpha proteobacterium IMCC14465]|uniref:Glutamine--fructose-6-phosphate aminotransferase [isomerizing] n=1 Tax=alpha proteobacterium IMCC14465 TaxID=1220535 RepID=J9DXH3_9PROT|nr:hypothetical protein IMCC14465_01160 [alpha proteobacterium IMCC14465]
MCGIIGIIGQEDVTPTIYEALKRLEYRGYDSAGIATILDNKIDRCRSQGKLVNLEAELKRTPLKGNIGIGHTRWATHGAPTQQNAHPHKADSVMVVHNGIIENYLELKNTLKAKGFDFQTETDTEVIAHLFSYHLAEHASEVDSIKIAARKTFAMLEGAYAIALLIENEDRMMIAARKGSPLVIGHGDNEMFVGSDAFSLAPMTNRITYLEDGDWAILTDTSLDIFEADGQPVKRPMQVKDASASLVDKGQHRHFMAKEIFEQPEVISHTFAHYVNANEATVHIPEFDFDTSEIKRIVLIACGSAYYAAMTGRYWLETLAGISTDIDIASEFRYRDVAMDEGTLAVFVSQSGETADTLAALKACKARNVKTLAIVNAPDSSMQREADVTLPTFAGPEIGVASTKAFICQLAVLFCFALALGKARVGKEGENELVKALLTLPRLMGEALKLEANIEQIATRLSKQENAIFIGRGLMSPLALEGALKLKEISYIHAEGFAAGELKHGSIALIEDNMPVITIAPKDAMYPKTISNMQEVIARQGDVILLTENPDKTDTDNITDVIYLPEINALLSPILYTIPLQLLAYHTAVAKGTDVDQPRNLAKSVTVE